MAIYHLHIRSISRSAGRSAIGAAAYRAGERIRDERTGVLHNHSGRRDVTHKEIILPSGAAGAAIDWASDRGALWNAAEKAEGGRRNARVAREYEVALPAELTAPQRVELARAFSRELADRHGVAIDLAVHQPRPAGDPRNHHAHLLATTRELSGAGLGAKAGLDMHSSTRQRLGLEPGIIEFNRIRERWADLTNEALAAAALSVRVDNRSYQARGIDREPYPHIPYAAVLAERRGVRSELAEQLRERYRQRVQERTLRQAERSRGAADEVPETGAQPAAPAQSLQELRQQAQQAWRRLRTEALQSAVAAKETAISRPKAVQATAARENAAGPAGITADRDYSLE